MGVAGAEPVPPVSLRRIAAEWTRIGCIGFGGPPTHIALLRKRLVVEREWLDGRDFEDAIAATNLLPGPASTQLAIYCAWRLRGRPGAVIGGLCFIAPGLLLILCLAALFLADDPPLWVLGAAAGSGAAVPAVAVDAASQLLPASRARSRATRAGTVRWTIYLGSGAVVSALAGTYLVLVLVACGLVEVVVRRPGPRDDVRGLATLAPPGSAAFAAIAAGATGGWGAIVWVAVKVGALSYGGGFVIIPLMQHDAVEVYRWMTDAQFLDAVALGQITPGPVVQTVAVVGYAAAGVAGGLLAAAVAFTPSFVFVLVGGPRFHRLRDSVWVQSFLAGAGPAAIGAIAGAAVPLGRALAERWQYVVLAGALVWFLARRRGVVIVLLAAAVTGVLAAELGAPIGR
jgi:chromate transporter